MGKYKHGHSRRNSKDGAYHSWSYMMTRCTNQNRVDWKHYGGRGITFQGDWRNFTVFLRDMGPRPLGGTLERINNDLGYSKANCRWATRAEQANNCRSNRRFTFNGKELNIVQWSKEMGINFSTLYARLAKGWTIAKALTKPIGNQGKKRAG